MEENTAMADTQRAIIQIENISKQFPGVQALDQVSIDIYPGEIHAIIGENGAGKSTLMNVLAGEVRPDSGRIIYRGQEQEIPNPFISQQLGISVVYQETALCPNLNASENISLGAASSKSALNLVNRRQFRQTAKDAMSRLGISNIDFSIPVGQFTIAQQQLVEIAKALSIKAKVLILDEPNSALTNEETDHLFNVLKQVKESNVAIIYISHRLEEVLSIADKISVLRDGILIETADAETSTVDGLISRMVGREVDELFHHEKTSEAGEEVALEVQNLQSGDFISEVTFNVHSGEIVGIAGLPDSGKDELIECLYGLRSCTADIRVNHKDVNINSPSGAIDYGLSFVPADRRGAGSILVLSAQDNVIASSLEHISQLGVINQGASRGLAREYVNKLDIRLSNLKQTMATLSGGNQQKVILARGLATKPSILLLHEPTRGIDVGAKADIYSILHNLAADGVGFLIVSSELPELIGQCDRILVMYQGRITGEFSREEFDEETILACAMGQVEHLRRVI
jgi:ribose transport system ATP-binding protein